MIKYIISILLIIGLLFSPRGIAQGPNHNLIWNTGENEVNIWRIPGLIVTKSGIIIAYVEARHGDGRDEDKVDFFLKRSFDGGLTWARSYIIERSQGKEDYVLPTLVQDRLTGRIFFFSALRDEGLSDKTTTNTFRFSDDDGATWSEPADITQILVQANEEIARNGFSNWVEGNLFNTFGFPVSSFRTDKWTP